MDRHTPTTREGKSMAVRRFLVITMAAGAVAGPVAADAAAPVQVQAVSHASAKTSAAADSIALDVERNGSLAVRLSWSGGAGPYDVLIDPSKGEGSYESGVDDTELTVAAEPDRSYCFEVYGSDGSASDRECVSAPRL
jgi:hypothetical protein